MTTIPGISGASCTAPATLRRARSPMQRGSGVRSPRATPISRSG
nr:MAG TPA: hypothetical protein [Caudoviricetes sp.]